jgi:hypothetical protein
MGVAQAARTFGVKYIAIMTNLEVMDFHRGKNGAAFLPSSTLSPCVTQVLDERGLTNP